MDIELLGTSELSRAYPDWERLHGLDVLATPFNSPVWARIWLEKWDPECEAFVLRVLEDGRTVGIVPLAVRRRWGVRWLITLGKEPGDYWDILAAPEDRLRVATAAGQELLRRRGSWDTGIINCLPPGSRTLDEFAAAGLRRFVRPPIPSPAIRLPDSFEEYLRGLSKARRSNLRRHLDRLDRGDVRVRELRDVGEVPATMTRWRELRERQWQARGRQISSLHQQEHFHRFMAAAASGMLEAGFAVLWELLVGDAVAGVYLNFADDRSFYWYLGGFEPEYARLGLGKIAVAATLRASIEAGRRWYDFTRGDEGYKYWYGAQDRPLDSVVLGHPGVASRSALAAARMVSAYRDRRSSE